MKVAFSRRRVIAHHSCITWAENPENSCSSFVLLVPSQLLPSALRGFLNQPVKTFILRAKASFAVLELRPGIPLC